MPEITKQDMIVLLNQIAEQFVVAMVKHGEGEERDPIIDMLSRNTQIINAITERVKEMTAVEYLEAFSAMCDDAGDTCDRCPIKNFTFPDISCRQLEERNPRRAVEIVKRWKEEHND